MEFKILTTEFNGRKFKIEEDHPEVGSYLYVYDGENCIKDYLQNDIETCKQVAFEEYKVPLDKWVLKES
ncbi:MAG: hypothetical protein JNL57_02750 [Bacteroidetes bacterium]|nr:hypothetical protein [Bacteroidota bacterium]